ncbi:MAG: hypothetical protein LBU51_07320 [Bacteroidales bacterium]|nr:hypothetical protein [Bacteroidales bacterium]
MKKIFLSIIVLLLTANIFAQEINSSPPKAEMLKHEVGGSIGAFPIIIIYPTISSSFNFSYFYHFNNRHAIGGSISFNPFTLGEKYGYGFSAELNYRFSFFRTELFYLYLSISAGFQFGLIHNSNWGFIAFQFMPIGINIGKEHSAFAEIGYGSQGIVKMGYRYRFNSK